MTPLPAVRGGPVPAFSDLVRSALWATSVPLCVLLLRDRLWPAIGVAGGAAFGLLMGAMVYSFVNHGLRLFVPVSAGAHRPSPGGQVGGFAAISVLKFLAQGALFFVLVVTLRLGLLWLVLGFLTAQGAMIASALKRLALTKVTD